MSSFGGVAPNAMPDIDVSSPPIGFGAAMHDSSMETTTIIPSAILAVMFDQAMKQAAGRVVAPVVEPKAQDRD
jgi:hypothetical protein